MHPGLSLDNRRTKCRKKARRGPGRSFAVCPFSDAPQEEWLFPAAAYSSFGGFTTRTFCLPRLGTMLDLAARCLVLLAGKRRILARSASDGKAIGVPLLARKQCAGPGAGAGP